MSEYFLNKFAEAELNADSQEMIANYLADLQDQGYDPEKYLFDVGLEKAAEYIDKIALYGKYEAKPEKVKKEKKQVSESLFPPRPKGTPKYNKRSPALTDYKRKKDQILAHLISNGSPDLQDSVGSMSARQFLAETEAKKDRQRRMSEYTKNNVLDKDTGLWTAKNKPQSSPFKAQYNVLRENYRSGGISLPQFAKGLGRLGGTTALEKATEYYDKGKDYATKGYNTVRSDMKAHPGRYWAGAGGAALGAGALAYYLHKRKKKQMQPKTASAGYGNDLVALAKQKLYGTN